MARLHGGNMLAGQKNSMESLQLEESEQKGRDEVVMEITLFRASGS